MTHERSAPNMPQQLVKKPYVRADWPRFDAVESVRRIIDEQKLYRTDTIRNLRFAAELMEQADRALVATIRAFRGGSEYVQQGAHEEVEKYHAMCGRYNTELQTNKDPNGIPKA